MPKRGHLWGIILAVGLLGQPGWAEETCDKAYAQQAKEIRTEYSKFADQVNLTTDQRQRLQAIKQATDQQVESLSQNILAKQRELFQAIFSQGATQEAAEQLTQEIMQFRSQIAQLKLAALLQARSVMTAEQQHQFALFQQRLMASLASRYPTCLQPLSNGALGN